MIEHDSQDIVVLGLPYDRNSSYLRGAALAPARIREALFSESANMWTENGIDLGEMAGWQFANDLTLDDPQAAFAQIEQKIAGLLDQNSQVISLGGDHSITYPIIRSYRKHFADLSILQLDAHPDLYDELDGNRLSHACPFARIMEEKLVQRLVQVGIRTLTGHQRRQADQFGVEIIEMHAIDKLDQLTFNGPVYLSLDMDCLDPAFAPGVSHYEPGGLSTRQVLDIIQNLKGQLVGADIVEYNPLRDPQGMTAMVAAKLLKELISKMMQA
jgi:agmatinase